MEDKLVPILIGVLQVLLSGFTFVLWTNFNEVKALANKSSKDLMDQRIHIAENYTTKTDLAKTIETLQRSMEGLSASMTQRFDKIDNKLDSKADKGA
jgi:hypothetical protein